MFCWQINDDINLKLLDPSLAISLFNLVENNNKFLTKWLNWAIKASDYEYLENYILYSQNVFSENKGFHAAIYFRNDLVGIVTLEYSSMNKCGSIGYWLIEDYNGKGIITMCCQAIVDYSFKEIYLNRLEIRCAQNNIKSQKIPLALGFQKEGVIHHAEEIRKEIIHHVIFGLTIEDYNLL